MKAGAPERWSASEGLPLERGVERLREGVVGAGADAAERLDDPELAAEAGVVPGRVSLGGHRSVAGTFASRAATAKNVMLEL